MTTEVHINALQLLVSAPGHGTAIADRLGMRNYSYHFVMQAFLPVLRRIADVVLLDDPVDAERYYDANQETGVDTVHLVFAPPHDVPTGLRCPTLPVFAWEVETIPTESWGNEPRNDWRVTLRESPAAITHSRYAARATSSAMGSEFPVLSIPAPIHERGVAQQIAGPPFAEDRRFRLDVDGVVVDSRALGLQRGFEVPPPSVERRESVLDLKGIVYTTVLNPEDGRKNWEDVITAFADAFGDAHDVTLVVKVVHHDPGRTLPLWDVMRRLAPFQCRIVLLCAFLDEENYAELIKATSYVVNASKGEGQCLPLMEFMSAGCPAVAPDHSAMAEYVSDANSFIVSSYQQWTHWPHDPRELLRTYCSVIEWDSLRQAYIDSYQEAVRTPEKYAERSREAIAAQERYCSERVVSRQLVVLLDKLVASRPGSGQSEPDQDSTATGMSDTS